MPKLTSVIVDLFKAGKFLRAAEFQFARPLMHSAVQRQASYIPPAMKYAHTFSDYVHPYKAHIDQHQEFFETISQIYEHALAKVDCTDATSVRLTYQKVDKILVDEINRVKEMSGMDPMTPEQEHDFQVTLYLTRLSGQWSTRWATFENGDPAAIRGIHNIHKQFTQKNVLAPEGRGTIPPLGRTFDNIADPKKTAHTTRTPANMKKTLGVEIGEEVKPRPVNWATHFVAGDKGVEKVERPAPDASNDQTTPKA